MTVPSATLGLRASKEKSVATSNRSAEKFADPLSETCPKEQFQSGTRSETSESSSSSSSRSFRQPDNVEVVGLHRKYPVERSESCSSQTCRDKNRVNHLFDPPTEKCLSTITANSRRNRIVEDRVIDYRELLNEFGISDSESAESQQEIRDDTTNGVDSTNLSFSSDNRANGIDVSSIADRTNDREKIEKKKPSEMGITASYVLNSDYEEPRDAVTGGSQFSPIKHLKSQSFPVKLDASLTVVGVHDYANGRQCREAPSSVYEAPCTIEPSASTTNSTGERSHDKLGRKLSVVVQNNFSSLPSKLERSRQRSSERARGCEIVSVLPKNDKSLVLGEKNGSKNDDNAGMSDGSTEQASKNNTDVDGSSKSIKSSPSMRSGASDDKINYGNRTDVKENTSKLPPRQQPELRGRRANLPTSPMSQKKRRFLHGKFSKSSANEVQAAENTDGDYDDVFVGSEHEMITRSRSLECAVTPRSAPVTPTEEKRIPFSKFLKKRNTPVFRESISDAVLVRVSSLPDEDLVDLGSSEHVRDENGTKSRILSSESSSGSRKVRAVSPLTLRSDVTAKRLSESDKNVSQISPVELKKFNGPRTNVNDVAVSCDLEDSDRASNEEKRREMAKSAEKLKIDDGMKAVGIDDNNLRSGSVSD